MYYLNILYCNVLSEDSCPASGLRPAVLLLLARLFCSLTAGHTHKTFCRAHTAAHMLSLPLTPVQDATAAGAAAANAAAADASAAAAADASAAAANAAERTP